jgi:hypothetical protein
VAAHGGVHLDLHAPLLGAAAAELGQGIECALRRKQCLIVFGHNSTAGAKITPLASRILQGNVRTIDCHAPRLHTANTKDITCICARNPRRP